MNKKIIMVLTILIAGLICLSTIAANPLNYTDNPTDMPNNSSLNNTVSAKQHVGNGNIKEPVKNNQSNTSKKASTKKTIKTDSLKDDANAGDANTGDDIGTDSACCSVVVQKSSKETVLSFRRDSAYQATINIEKVKWNKTNVIKQSKTTNGYFVHSIITEDGWAMGFGGADKVTIQSNVIKKAKDIYAKHKITTADMSKMYSLIKSLGVGHAVIKSPDGMVGVAIYNNGGKYFIDKLNNGEYVCVPNSVKYYRKGNYTDYSKDAVNASIKIAGHDKYGVNRRNIFTYHFNDGTVKIYVSNDNGKYTSRSTGYLKDPVNCFGKYINKSKIPAIPNKLLIGNVSYNKVIPTTYTIKQNGLNYNNLKTSIESINKYAKNNTAYILNMEKGVYAIDGKTNTTLKLDNKNVKNVKIIINGNNSILKGKNNAALLYTESGYDVTIKNMSLICGFTKNNAIITNRGNLSLISCVITNNSILNGSIISNNAGLNIKSSVIASNKLNKSFVINSKTKYTDIDNNWWGDNNPAWDNIIKNTKKPNAYVVMKFTNSTAYKNQNITFKTTLNTLNNGKAIKGLPSRLLVIYSPAGRYSKTMAIENESKTTYTGNPQEIQARIDNQMLSYTINKVYLKIPSANLKIGYNNTLKIHVVNEENKDVAAGTITATANGKNSKIPVNNGVANLVINPQISKVAINLTYNGNGNYSKSTYNAILKAEKTKTCIKADVIKYLNNSMLLKVNAYDENNKLLSYNTKISIKVNGITQINKYRLSKATGEFIINIPKKDGACNISIISGENSVYESSTTNLTLNKLKARTPTYLAANITRLSDNVSNLKVKIYDGENKLICGLSKLSIKVNSATVINKKQVSDGTINLNISLPINKTGWNVTIVSGETNNYTSSRITMKVF